MGVAWRSGPGQWGRGRGRGVAGALPVAAAGGRCSRRFGRDRCVGARCLSCARCPGVSPGPPTPVRGAGRADDTQVRWDGPGQVCRDPPLGRDRCGGASPTGIRARGGGRDCRDFSSDSGATRSRTRRGSVRVVRGKPGLCSAPPCPARGGHRGWAFPAAPPGLGLGIVRRTRAGGSRGRAGRGPRPLVPAGSGACSAPLLS